MYFSSQFANFDPLTGLVPKFPFPALPEIAQRARDLLKGRTAQQICDAASTADWMMEEYFQSEKEAYIQRLCEVGGWELRYLDPEDRDERGIRDLIDNWPSGADEGPPLISSAENMSEFEALQECIDSYDLTEQQELPDGKQYEYFAVMALWMLVDCIESLKPVSERAYLSDMSPEFRKMATDLAQAFDSLEFRYASAGSSAIQAMNALCYAEHLKAAHKYREELSRLRSDLSTLSRSIDSAAEEKAKKKISLTNSLNGTLSHARKQPAKELVKSCWMAWKEHPHQYKTQSEFASDMMTKVPLDADGKPLIAYETIMKKWIPVWNRETK